MLSHRQFLDALAEELLLHGALSTSDAATESVLHGNEHLVDDLHLDSLATVVVLVWIEDLAGRCDTTVAGLPGRCVDDLYAFYRRLAAPQVGAPPPRSSPP